MLRLASEQAASAELGLPFELADVSEVEKQREELSETLPESALFLVLEGQVPGLLVMDSSLIGGIVEHLTVGCIISKEQVSRPPTRVDAALIAPFVDGALSRFSRAAEAADIAPWGQGLAFGAMVPDRRSLLLALPVRDYHVFSCDLRLGEGLRQGRLILGFGERPQEVEGNSVERTSGGAGRATVRAGVLSAPARLDAVIARLSVRLKDLQALKVGDTLTLPADALRRTRLEAKGTDHGIRVSLGQLNGFRAVRLVTSDQRSSEPSEGGEVVGGTVRDLSLGSAAEPVPQIVQDSAGAPASGHVAVTGPEGGYDDLDTLLEAAEDVDVLTPV